MPLFDRIASLHVGAPGALGKDISKLRFKFTVEKSLTETTNKAKIEIYNLSEQTRADISSRSFLILKAGYKEDSGLETLFSGDVSRVLHSKEPPNVVTHIESNDGADVMQSTYISLSYKEGVSALSVLRAIAGKMGIPLQLSTRLSDTTYVGSFAYTGTAKEALTRVSKKLSASWSIQNGVLQVVLRGDSMPAPAVRLSSATGLVKSPERVKDTKTSIDSNSGKPSYKIRSLLIPRISPGSTVYVESLGLTRFFVVESVKHVGDTHDDDWYSETEVVEQ